MKHYKIVHVTVHLGGGIGTVLLNWIKKDIGNKHTILCLNRSYYNKYTEHNIHEQMHNRGSELTNWIEKADIVIVHFWNHPLLFDFLINTNIPKSRICFWSHVSGLNAPYVFSEKLIRFADQFVFSSPISYEAQEIKKLPIELMEKLKVIWTTGNVNEYLNLDKIPHDTFNIGCIGTFDYSKLHPNFIDMCSKIKIPNVKFIMCGGGCDLEKMKQQVKERGLESKFLFTGVIKDIKPYLAIIDVFGYPLNSKHFGTCEQVLGEAIAAGIIPIVMKNPAEEYILYKALLEFVCENEEEYVRQIESFYCEGCHPSIIEKMKANIVELYNLDNMIDKWNKIFEDLMQQAKTEKIWMPNSTKQKGYRIFIESLGSYGKVLESGSKDKIKKLFDSNDQWKSKSKGSVHQYLENFPEDELLQEWSKLA